MSDEVITIRAGNPKQLAEEMSDISCAWFAPG